jgi:hypothetical protein
LALLIRVLHIRRTYSSPARVFIQEQYKMIRGRLRQRRKKKAQPGQVSGTQEKIDWARQREQEYGCQSRKAVLTEWTERWHKERGYKASWPESIAALNQPF